MARGIIRSDHMRIIDQIVALLRVRPFQSAYQLSQRLGLNASNVASMCKVYTDKGVLGREPARGPRKGFGYYVMEPKQ